MLCRTVDFKERLVTSRQHLECTRSIRQKTLHTDAQAEAQPLPCGARCAILAEALCAHAKVSTLRVGGSNNNGCPFRSSSQVFGLFNKGTSLREQAEAQA